MGAWSFGSFDNDSALDWFSDVEADSSLINQVLREVADAGESRVDTNAAAAIGKGDERLSPSVAPWLRAHRAEVAAIDVGLARRAVQRVFENSELCELFSDHTEWHADVRELLRRLE